jgi:hypothetical protein
MTTEHAATDKPRGSATSGADAKPPLRIVRLAVDAQGLALVIMASIAVIFVQVSSELARLRQGQRGAMQKIQSTASELEQAASATCSCC